MFFDPEKKINNKCNDRYVSGASANLSTRNKTLNYYLHRFRMSTTVTTLKTTYHVGPFVIGGFA